MSKPPDHTMGKYLQFLLRRWLAEDETRDEATFARMSGLSKASINNLKNKGVGAGSKTVAGVAKVLGRSVPQLHAEAEAWITGRPSSAGPVRFCDLSGWSDCEARLRRTGRGRGFSEEAWRAAATTTSGYLPGVVDDFTVLRLVEFWHLTQMEEPPASESKPRNEPGRPPSSPNTARHAG